MKRNANINRYIKLPDAINKDAYIRLVTTYLMEYAEDWSIYRAYFSKQSIQTLLQKAA